MHVLVRPPGPAFREALSRHPDRHRIDPARAVAQHAAFVASLEAGGATVVRLAEEPAMPDATFVSDVLLALPRASGERPALPPSVAARAVRPRPEEAGTALLVVARPAAESRRPEVASVLAAARGCLAEPVPEVAVTAPATLEGGDVIVYGLRIAIGISARTDRAGASALAAAAAALGYRPFLCPVRDRLHLASAVTALGANLLIGTRAGFASLDEAGPDAAPPSEIVRLVVPDAELPGANVLALDGRCYLAAGNPVAAALLREAGLRVVEVELDEFTLADGGPTCLVNIVP